MKTKLLAILLAVALLFCSCTKNQEGAASSVENTANTAAKLELDNKIEGLITAAKFSGSAFVANKDTVLFDKAYGYSDLAQSKENTTQTAFLIASLTKQFTGAAIFQLEEAGKLSPEDTLDKYFPKYAYCKDITIADLLAMKAGFDDLDLTDMLTSDLSKAYAELSKLTPQQGEDFILEKGATRSKTFHYSNTSYYLLGRIIEKASGLSYNEYVKEKLLTPPGMNQTGFAGEVPTAEPITKDAFVIPSTGIYTLFYSAAALVSTTGDLNKWLDAYFGGKLFKSEYLERLNGYNYGWYNDGVWYHHDGVFSGVRANIMYDKSTGTKAILLANNDNLDSSGIYNLGRYISIAANSFAANSITEE
ncbi:MAG: beta-lactamase family protein [Oscillospiraceae bacterium]|jgi:CubicO group peptidase (beta-lactamase class C family)|nr:beta-lactamase family protein [Oscillospiraceae bacterium]